VALWTGGLILLVYALYAKKLWAGIATRYGLDDPGIESRWEQIFPQLYRRKFRAHPASYTTRTVSLSRGVKRPECSVKHPLPSSAEVKERVEIYLYYTSGPSWPVVGRTCYAKKVQMTNLYLGTPWRHVGGNNYSSTHFWPLHLMQLSGQLYSPDNTRSGSCQCSLYRRLGVMKGRFGRFGEEKTFLRLRGKEPRIHGFSASSQVTKYWLSGVFK
jgi:hypothetical protein